MSASFIASLAKWRYETVHDVFGQIDRIRWVCEGRNIRGMFDNTQDMETLNGVQAACDWPGLWRFITAFLNFVLDPIEHGRRWGLLCPHPEHNRMRSLGMPVQCINKSWRL